jgi:hypothetical protein
MFHMMLRRLMPEERQNTGDAQLHVLLMACRRNGSGQSIQRHYEITGRQAKRLGGRGNVCRRYLKNEGRM